MVGFLTGPGGHLFWINALAAAWYDGASAAAKGGLAMRDS